MPSCVYLPTRSTRPAGHMTPKGAKSQRCVRFSPDVPQKMRPTASNLRPFERMSKKSRNQANVIDELVRALTAWDEQWRLYLHAHYDDSMILRQPRSTCEAEELTSRQEYLHSLALECIRLHSMLPPKGGLSSPVNSASTWTWRINSRESYQRQVLYNVVEAVAGWRRTEHKRWSSILSSEIDHSAFCDYCERIETFQKKYKSAGDGVRRLKKKAVRDQPAPPAVNPVVGLGLCA